MSLITKQKIKKELDALVLKYNCSDFIEHDPISVPHAYSLKQDIEIAAFFAAIFSWGNRTTIINKSKELLARMDNAPYEFILHHQEHDLKALQGFVHRTFNDTDLLYCVDFFQRWYSENNSLELAFTQGMHKGDTDVEKGLVLFKKLFFQASYAPKRTQKHVSSPVSKSACKRLNMFLRWMVRSDQQKVDFGIWKSIKPHQLVCPLDVHVDRIAKHYGLVKRSNTDWLAAVELTNSLKEFDALDPVKYDFALFGLGVNQKF